MARQTVYFTVHNCKEYINPRSVALLTTLLARPDMAEECVHFLQEPPRPGDARFRGMQVVAVYDDTRTRTNHYRICQNNGNRAVVGVPGWATQTDRRIEVGKEFSPNSDAKQIALALRPKPIEEPETPRVYASRLSLALGNGLAELRRA